MEFERLESSKAEGGGNKRAHVGMETGCDKSSKREIRVFLRPKVGNHLESLKGGIERLTSKWGCRGCSCITE